MLKTRLIPVLYIKNGLIVRSEGFSYHQNIGNIINEAHRYNEWDVDELIYIDISSEKHYDLRRDDHKIKPYSTITDIIREIANVCFMPLTFGGGIASLEDIDLRIRHGADKVTLNTAVQRNPRLVQEASYKYGAQCIVASIDYKMQNGKAMVWVDHGTEETGVELLDWIRRCENLGAGELFINAIDRDGKASGYDIETLARACAATRLPVVACGGAGDPFDFVELYKAAPVSALAAGNLFHFTENSYPRAKQVLKKNHAHVR